MIFFLDHYKSRSVLVILECVGLKVDVIKVGLILHKMEREGMPTIYLWHPAKTLYGCVKVHFGGSRSKD